MSSSRSSMIAAFALMACLSGPMPTLFGQTIINDTCDLAFVNSVILNPGLNAGFSNVGATVSGVSPSCAIILTPTPTPLPQPAQPADVWFIYAAQTDCDVTFTVIAPTLLLPILAIYDGNGFTSGSCGTLPELACSPVGPSITITLSVNAGDILFLQFGDLIPGSTSLIDIDVQTSFRLNISAPTGTGSLQVDNSCGLPGTFYITVFTPTPGAFPNGSFFGLDISTPDLISQVYLGAPFFGTLDSTGSSSWAMPGGGIPSGLSLYAVSVQLDSTGLPITASDPVLFVTP